MSVSVRNPPPRAGWALSLCAAAGEGGGSFVSSKPPKPRGFVGGPAADPARARAEAGRRARGRLRRYCAANRLTRLGTLTYAGEGVHDQREVRQHVGVFFRNLRDSLGGEPMPYVWVPEWHKNHGLHLHFGVGQFIPRGKIAAAWGRGHVHIKLKSARLPAGAGSLAQARANAGYLSKYVSKTFEAEDDPAKERPRGLHRFDVAQGFTPKTTRIWATSRAELIEFASGAMGGAPERMWFSADEEEWEGPPSLWLQW
ncbi:hypothetical protein GCM10009721_34000 [Terrabacter tumescens]|uniref:Replication-associated protein ORF2/G2P domain-containing protein n=1 Tax=Terrabacter tumescens TaxID=60443 RepID=A0ABQ2I9I1_9MICO|nr:hypothetical protein GCM10009721_34000 [Terrabacter tumescens]